MYSEKVIDRYKKVIRDLEKIIKLKDEIIFIYETYTDQIEFTDEDIKKLDKLETKIAKI